MFSDKPRQGPKEEVPGWWELEAGAFNPPWGLGQASLGMLCLGRDLDGGREATR